MLHSIKSLIFLKNVTDTAQIHTSRENTVTRGKKTSSVDL